MFEGFKSALRDLATMAYGLKQGVAFVGDKVISVEQSRRILKEYFDLDYNDRILVRELASNEEYLELVAAAQITGKPRMGIQARTGSAVAALPGPHRVSDLPRSAVGNRRSARRLHPPLRSLPRLPRRPPGLHLRYGAGRRSLNGRAPTAIASRFDRLRPATSSVPEGPPIGRVHPDRGTSGRAIPVRDRCRDSGADGNRTPRRRCPGRSR